MTLTVPGSVVVAGGVAAASIKSLVACAVSTVFYPGFAGASKAITPGVPTPALSIPMTPFTSTFIGPDATYFIPPKSVVVAAGILKPLI